MNTEMFEQEIESAHQRITALSRRASQASEQPHSILQEAFEEIHTMFEELRVAQEEIREQNERLIVANLMAETERFRYRELFDFAPDAYLVTDMEGIIREANHAAAALLDIEQEFLSPKPLAVFISEEDRSLFRIQLSRLASSERVSDWPIRMRTRRHTMVDVLATVSLSHDQDGRPIAIRWLLRPTSVPEPKEESIRVDRHAGSETDQLAAETARRHLAFLAEASAIIAESLDYATTMARVVRMVVPYLADWCIIDLLEEDRTIRRMAVVHRDPKLSELTQELQRRSTPDLRDPSAVSTVLQQGKSLFYSAVSEAEEAMLASKDDCLRILQEMGLKSVMVVPIRVRGQMLGALTLGVGEARPSYTEGEHILGMEIGRRAAAAIANSRLYRTALEEIAAHQQAEEESNIRRTQVEALNLRLQRAVIESHHRIKNNLQTLAALANVRLMDRPESIEAQDLKLFTNQIGLLAVLHDLLTQQAREDGHIHLLSVQSVLEQVLQLLQQTAPDRHIWFELDNLLLPVALCTSLALIANEIVSNAIKYGRNEIAVTLQIVPRRSQADSEKAARLEICDDGPGFPNDFDPTIAAHTGLELVRTLVHHDLRGEVHYENRPEGGAQVGIEFPLPD